MSSTILVSLVLALAAGIDYRTHRIPNWLTGTAFVSGILFNMIVLGWEGLKWSLLGGLVGFGLLILFYAIGAMGAGDVKLMAAAGVWAGAAAAFQAFLWTAVIGGLVALFLMAASGQFQAQLRKVRQAGWNLLYFHDANTGAEDPAVRKIRFPYGVSIALGFYAYFLFGGLI
ncbi:MAG: prepilin peptidase [bacterium]